MKEDIGAIMFVLGLVSIVCLGGAETPSLWYNAFGAGGGIIIAFIGAKLMDAIG